jgi:hypothetical protein
MYLIDEGRKLEDVWMIKEDESWKMFVSLVMIDHG